MKTYFQRPDRRIFFCRPKWRIENEKERDREREKELEKHWEKEGKRGVKKRGIGEKEKV